MANGKKPMASIGFSNDDYFKMHFLAAKEDKTTSEWLEEQARQIIYQKWKGHFEENGKRDPYTNY